MNIESEFYLVERINSLGNYTVTEGYRKAPGLPFSQQPIATWSHTDGLKIPQSEKYERRSNLSGVNFDIVTLQNRPFSIVEGDKFSGAMVVSDVL